MVLVKRQSSVVLLLLGLLGSRVCAAERRQSIFGGGPSLSKIALKDSFGRIRRTLQREIDAFQDPGGVVRGRLDEDVVSIIRSIPGAVQEGHQQSIDGIKYLLSVASRDGTMRALKELRPIVESLAGMSRDEDFDVPSGGMMHKSQAALLADLRTQSTGLVTHATKWITDRQESHLSQALQRLTAVAERSMEVDDKEALQAVQRIIIMLRTTTDGAMIPGADGNRKVMSPTQHRLVTELSPEVLKMLNRLEKEKGLLKKDPRLHLYIAEALGFNLGTQSMMSQARALDQVARMSRSIDLAMKQQPKIDNGMPYVIRGMFHLNCPRPLKSVPKAKECFDQALKIAPNSGRNLYFCGVAAYLDKDYEKAVKFYEAAQTALIHEIKRDPQYAYLEPECHKGLQLSKEMLTKMGGTVITPAAATRVPTVHHPIPAAWLI